MKKTEAVRNEYLKALELEREKRENNDISKTELNFGGNFVLYNKNVNMVVSNEQQNDLYCSAEPRKRALDSNMINDENNEQIKRQTFKTIFEQQTENAAFSIGKAIKVSSFEDSMRNMQKENESIENKQNNKDGDISNLKILPELPLRKFQDLTSDLLKKPLNEQMMEETQSISPLKLSRRNSRMHNIDNHTKVIKKFTNQRFGKQSYKNKDHAEVPDSRIIKGNDIDFYLSKIENLDTSRNSPVKIQVNDELHSYQNITVPLANRPKHPYGKEGVNESLSHLPIDMQNQGQLANVSKQSWGSQTSSQHYKNDQGNLNESLDDIKLKYKLNVHSTQNKQPIDQSDKSSSFINDKSITYEMNDTQINLKIKNTKNATINSNQTPLAKDIKKYNEKELKSLSTKKVNIKNEKLKQDTTDFWKEINREEVLDETQYRTLNVKPNENLETKFLNIMQKNAALIKKQKEPAVRIKTEDSEGWNNFEERVKLNDPATEQNKRIVLEDIVRQKDVKVMKQRNLNDIAKFMPNTQFNKKNEMSENMGVLYSDYLKRARILQNNSQKYGFDPTQHYPNEQVLQNKLDHFE